MVFTGPAVYDIISTEGASNTWFVYRIRTILAVHFGYVSVRPLLRVWYIHTSGPHSGLTKVASSEE